MAMLTQGSQLYFIDPDDDTVVAVECLTNFNPGGAPAGQIPTSCLEDTSGVDTFLRGNRVPGQATVQINADPRYASHIRLHELSQGVSDVVLKFTLGWSDGTTPPDVGSDGDFDLPPDRTWYSFDGYIADFPFDFQLNSVVASTVSVQRSGPAVWTPKAISS